ncbi:MAG TPA: tetratricopeptide repeat protein [Fimbriimonadaceae bacterium]|jgi:hypothetical protein
MTNQLARSHKAGEYLRKQFTSKVSIPRPLFLTLLFLLMPAFGIAQLESDLPKPFTNARDKEVTRALKLEQQGKVKEAFDLLSRLAEKKNGDAILHLSEYYLDGKGVKKDKSQAIAWLQKGVDWHLADCTCTLAIYYGGGVNGLARNHKKCVDLLRQASDEGSLWAMVALGNSYRTGSGVKKDNLRALELFYKAANLGNTSGMYEMGMASAAGLHGPADDEAAEKWFEKAIAGGAPEAFGPCGLELLELNRPEDAISAFEKGAEFGSRECMLQLGSIYETGIHGKFLDREKAITWYRKAAKLGSEDAKAALNRLRQE